jgi:regulator of sigma D
MNNEPVAWIPKDHLKEIGKAGFRYTGVSYQEDKFYNIPLYTHPAKTPTLVLDGNRVYPAFKEITDEEILNLFEPKYDVEIDDEMLVDFARAILKRAQEK